MKEKTLANLKFKENGLQLMKRINYFFLKKETKKYKMPIKRS